MNEGNRNNLTGKSGKAINAMLAAYDRFVNLSMISLNDRKLMIDFLGLSGEIDFEKWVVV
jgi:hypothetical protein